MMKQREFIQDWRKKGEPVMSPEELLAKVQAIKHPTVRFFTIRNQALITMMYLAAGRCSEIVGMTPERGVRKGDITQIEDPKQDNRRFTIIHTDNLKNPETTEKDVPVPHDRHPDSEFLKIIWSYINDFVRTDKLFPIGARRAQQIVDECMGKEFSPHYFRHTRLTHLTQFSRLSPWELRQIGGWRSTSMAENYIHSDYRTLLDKL